MCVWKTGSGSKNEQEAEEEKEKEDRVDGYRSGSTRHPRTTPRRKQKVAGISTPPSAARISRQQGLVSPTPFLLLHTGVETLHLPQRDDSQGIRDLDGTASVVYV